MSFIYKNLSKIILTFFFIFIFTFFINTNKVSAFETIGNACGEYSATSTQYILTVAEKSGIIDLCFKDTSGDTVKIYLGIDDSGTEIHSTTTTGAFQHFLYSTNYTATLGTLQTFNFISYDAAVEDSALNVFRLTLLPAYKVKFLNPSPTDGVTTDEFSSLTVGGNSKNVASPYITVYQNSTSTSEALGGTPSNPASVNVTGGT